MRASCPCRVEGGHEIAHVVVENDDAGGVTLAVRHIGEAGGEEARVLHFFRAMRAELHRPAHVEKDGHLAVGLAAVPLEEHLFGARVDVPIDVAQIVAGRIGAVFGELLAESEIGRAVEARDEAVDHGFRDQIEPGDAAEDFRI